MRRGLLHVNVLAGITSVNAHDGVPVFGRCNQDGLNVTVLQQPAVVTVGLRICSGETLPPPQTRVVDITYSHDLYVGVALEIPLVIRSHVAATDHPHPDSVVG